MGRFDFEDTEMLRLLERLNNYDEIAQEILEESVPVLTKNLKAELQKHKRTGIMLGSIKASGAKKNAYGWYITVRPTGYSRKYMDNNGKVHDRKEGQKVRNMALLAHMEYGTREQPATPVIQKVHNDSRDEVHKIAQEVFEREVKA